MRAINTKLATLSSTTRTVASLGMVGFLMGCVSVTLSDICSPRQEFLNFPDQLINVKRLLNIAITACFERFFLVATHHIGSQCQNGNAFKTGHRSDPGR